jgi:hypothetical protein
MLSERAKDAEKKVQMFLDQFESSVDNYRRQSRMAGNSAGAPPLVNGHPISKHVTHESVSGDSLYSATSTSDPDDDETETEGRLTPSANHAQGVNAEGSQVKAIAGPNGESAAPAPVQAQHARDRSSTALDSLASELETLRSQWETTNQNYRLSDRFDFERTPISAGTDGDSLGMGESLANWRAKLDLDDNRKSDDSHASSSKV